ncbi:hypothetical protein HYT84_02495 [Candidatus Micrarchaeota archaeon]|nr:hypothetical protein [Candidatus Micrarchaeota archaeon]
MVEVNFRKLHSSLMPKIKQDVFGPSSQIFVGSQNYPNLAIGPLVSIDEVPLTGAELYDLDYLSIIERSASLVRGKRTTYVSQRIEEKMKEVSLSEASVDVEMHLKKPPILGLNFSQITSPLGASGQIEKYNLAGNPKIPKKVDSILDENLKSAEAIAELAHHGLSNYYLMSMLSIGVLGKQENRKLVPTRWSITATDDTLGKQMMVELRDYSDINEILLFENTFLHNRYHILLLPGRWEFENFESWQSPPLAVNDSCMLTACKGSDCKISSVNSQSQEWNVSEEYERHEGRSDYAKEQVGGYYASRYSVLEYLTHVRKQARVVIFREIDDEYNIPVGVWQVREGVKHAFDSPPLKFNSREEVYSYLSTKLKVPVKKYQQLSRVLRQTRLLDF